ncbi:flagellar basal body-associated protein FliL [Bacillus chungangensis]|uniref:Flagellar protein FliL n=1 Tax=Bacillus chungangensis TaxID=587633 RepID=A0ABT9WRF7_9BACI|nr:flagellar basal body-associated protein FliL [Bacillus chungangensis]MDQ0175814.1 flagellar FliL protein [Bacillus chungangensis]
MKNNVFTIIMVLVVAILLVGGIALAVVYTMNNNNIPKKNPSIDEVLEASVDIEEITTNLASNDFIRISFKIQTDNKKAKKELEKRDFQVKNAIIEELSEMKSEELDGRSGKHKLEDTIKTRINELMENGEIVKVYITSHIVQ